MNPFLGKSEDMNTVKPHPEEDIGEPWGAWRVRGAALEAGKSNYYCKFSPEIRINPKNACKIGAKKSTFHGVLRWTTDEIKLGASMYRSDRRAPYKIRLRFKAYRRRV